jgi:predicted O-linked N-acetylglucosamine transferase (SPINDLY family)
MSGDRWASRISASLLLEAGLPEFVAADVEDYIARAIARAADRETPAQLDSLRRSIRDRLRAAPVCDVIGFTRDLEGGYLRMVHRANGA